MNDDPSSPDARRAVDIAVLSKIQNELTDKITTAIADAHDAAAAKLGLSSCKHLLSSDHFAMLASQSIFSRLCGADPRTLEGGSAGKAAQIIHAYQILLRKWSCY